MNAKKYCKRTTKKLMKLEKNHPVATTVGIGVTATTAAYSLYSLSYPVRRAVLSVRCRKNNRKLAAAANEVVKDLQAEAQQEQTQQ